MTDKRGNSLSALRRNSAKYTNDHRDRLKLTYFLVTNVTKQRSKIKHSFEFTYSDFPCHFKVNRDKLV